MVPGQVLEQVPAAGLAAWPHLYRQEEVRHAEIATAKTSIPTVELSYNMSKQEHSSKSKAHEFVCVSTKQCSYKVRSDVLSRVPMGICRSGLVPHVRLYDQ